MEVCVHCGTEIPPGARFWPGCSAPVEAALMYLLLKALLSGGSFWASILLACVATGARYAVWVSAARALG